MTLLPMPPCLQHTNLGMAYHTVQDRAANPPIWPGRPWHHPKPTIWSLNTGTAESRAGLHCCHHLPNWNALQRQWMNRIHSRYNNWKAAVPGYGCVSILMWKVLVDKYISLCFCQCKTRSNQGLRLFRHLKYYPLWTVVVWCLLDLHTWNHFTQMSSPQMNEWRYIHCCTCLYHWRKHYS